MKRILLLALLLPLSAQTLLVVHFTPQEAATLRDIRQHKEYWDAQWSQAESYIRRKYTVEPGVAEAGDASVPVDSYKSPWQWGIVFSPDYEVAVPKPEPAKEESHPCSN